MFLGEFTHTIDDKGRLTIPAKFRGALASGLVITRGFDRNLMLFPLDGWKDLADAIAAKPLGDEGVRSFRRRVFSGAIDLVPDRQGRIVLPQFLREFAGIDSEVVITGMYSYLEIWNVEVWWAERAQVESSDDASRWDALGI